MTRRYFMTKIVDETDDVTHVKTDDTETENVDQKVDASNENPEQDSIDESAHSEVKDELSELQVSFDSLKGDLTIEKEKSLRAMAELENFKKRKEQEVSNFKRYANESVIIDLLTVLDSCHLAAAHQSNPPLDESSDSSEGSPADDSVAAGVALIVKQFESALVKHGVKEIESLNQPFDPNLHQAVSQFEKDGVGEGIVLEVMQRGYQLHDRVIRPAMVVVSK